MRGKVIFLADALLYQMSHLLLLPQMGFKVLFFFFIYFILKLKYTLPSTVREIGPGHSCENLHHLSDLWLLEISVCGLQYLALLCLVMQGRGLVMLKAVPCGFVGLGVV